MSLKNSSRPGFLRQLNSLLGKGNQRRNQRATFRAPTEQLETRQLLAADLSKALYQEGLLEKIGPDTKIDSYFVAFNGPVNAAEIKAATGADSVTPYAPMPNTFDINFNTSITLQAAADRISVLNNFEYLSPNVDQDVELRLIPNDPFFPAQWYLRNTGQTNGVAGNDLRVTGVWDTYRGNGVTVAVVDDGVDILHPDLLGNISSAGLDLVGNDTDPTPLPTSTHGTVVAGVIAAVGNNNEGITGTAFGASIAGIRLLSASPGNNFTVSATNTATALTHAINTISISNNSWGPTGNGDISFMPPQVRNALSTGTINGRNGRGVVYVWAAGNDGATGDYVNYDPYASSRHVIAVGAVDHSGVHSAYSERGASLLVTAYSTPAAFMALDLSNDNGVNADPPSAGQPDPDQERYNGVLLNRNYTRRLGDDTSTAAAQVSGVVALMLEANSTLSYRDVMDILVRTSRRTDPGDVEWTQNGAGLWVNYKYGFGVVDAQAAVNAALTHVNRAPIATDNTGVVQVNTLVPDMSVNGVSATVESTSALSLEHVELTLSATHQRRGDFRVTLISPSGTRAVMAEERVLSPIQAQANYTNYTFTTPRFWGEEAIGTWTVELQDLQTGATGTFNSFQLNFYGTELPLAVSVSPRSIVENAGANAATGTVSRPASANLALPLDVLLFSSDTTEATVPTMVTIPAGRRSVTFPINAVDDALLDGLQTTRITASIGSYTAGVNLDVLDYEELTISVSPVAFAEDAGPGAATLTITRSNTNIDPPNKIVAVNNELRRYDDAGVQVGASITIPWPPGPVRPVGQNARDVVVMDNGNIAVYNGTSNAFLSVLNVGTNVWSHISLAGLSTSGSGTGGISTTGDYVFLTDMETSVGDQFGLVRVDVKTGAVIRFGTRSYGNRLFTNTLFDSSIYEINPITGAVIKQIPLPGGNSGDAGLAFDGTFVWYMPGNSNTLMKINPDTSTVADTFTLNYGGTTRNIQGLAWLRGQIYMADTANEHVVVFDPTLRAITRVINVGGVNGIWLGSGLTGSPAADPINDTLFVTGQRPFTGTYEIYQISIGSGVILNRFNGDTWDSGLAVVGNELYVGARAGTNGGLLRVYSLAGVFLRNITLPSGTFFFDTYGLGSDGVPGLVPTTFRYRDTTIGLDGRLYALDVNGTDVGVFDPATLSVINFLKLSTPVRAITVAADGTIYGGEDTGDVITFNSQGQLVGRVSSGLGVINDIDLNNAGKILLSDIVGGFATTDRTLAAFSVSSTLTVSDAFISFGESAVFSTADLVVTISNPDPTELSVPLTVIIPAGQSFIDVPIDAVDDFIRDGAQQVVISVSAKGYVGSSRTVVVLDAEGISVDVIAPSISESAGANATKVKVWRTDVQGPFTYLSTQEFSNSNVLDIPDNGRTYSPIVIPPQVSRIRDLDITVNFQHQWLGDLDVFLISPMGTRVELFTDLVSNGKQMTGTILDDQANQSINLGTAPYTGRFMPEGLLSKFNGESLAGTWLLEITDDNTFDTGKLLGWSMRVQTEGLEAVTVVLESTVPGKALFQGSATKTVVIPANQSEILVDLDAVDNQILDGDTVVTVRSTSTNISDFSLGNDTVIVTDSELITLTVDKSTVSEAAGAAAITGTVKRFNTDIGADFIVTLTSSNTSKLTVPASVTIPAGQMSAQFSINAIDNAVVDGDFVVSITATAPGYEAIAPVQITVTDQEPILRVSTLTPTVAENGVSFNVTVTRLDQTPAALLLPQVVNLTADPGLTVPLTVTIPANEDKVTFSVNIVDNARLDGTRTSSITASGPGIQSGSLAISITDYETLTLTVDKTSFLENAGSKAAVGTVTRSNTENLSLPLVVTLSSSDETELTVPATVTIPAGQVSVNFFIAAINDPDLDGPQAVTITAMAAGYVSGTIGVTVEDHEPPVLTGPTSTTVSPRPQVTWNHIPGALRYDVWVSNLSSGVSQLLRNVNVTSNTFTPPENLGIGRYRVWVRAIDSLERPGFWSYARDFTINTAPAITSPAPTVVIANSQFPKITWSAVADATRYELWVNNLTTGTALVINKTGVNALSTTSYVSTEGLGSGTYRIWVRGKNGQGEFGLWSAPITHTVLAPPVITQPNTGGTFDRTPTFAWTATTGATSYDLWVGNANTNAIVLRNQFVTTTQLNAPNDMPVGEYRVWVRAQSGNSYSAWSNPTSFSIGLPPKITSATTVGSGNAAPKISWTTISETETYELWVNNAAGVRVIHFTNLTTATYTSPTNLPSGTYRIWVRAVSRMGETTAWSTPVNLTIASGESQPLDRTTGQTTILASMILDDVSENLEPVSSSETLVVEDTATGPVQVEMSKATPIQAAVLPAPVEGTEPGPAVVAAQDEVMSQWQSADWWVESSEPADRQELDGTAALAASLGLFVRSPKKSDERRKRILN